MQLGQKFHTYDLMIHKAGKTGHFSVFLSLDRLCQ